MDMSKDSIILFFSVLNITASETLNLLGSIRQISNVISDFSMLKSTFGNVEAEITVSAGNFDSQSYLNLTSIQNLTINYVFSSNTRIKSQYVFLGATGAIIPPSKFMSSCTENINTTIFSCDSNNNYLGETLYNNTLVVTAERTILFEDQVAVEATAILICAPYVSINANSVISTGDAIKCNFSCFFWRNYN